MTDTSEFSEDWRGAITGKDTEFDYEYDLINPDVVVATTMSVQLTPGLDREKIGVRIEPSVNGGTLIIVENTGDKDTKWNHMYFPGQRIDANEVTVEYRPTDGYFHARFPHTEADIEAQREASGPDFGNAYTA